MRVRTLLPLICLSWPEYAASQPDWTRTCSAISHFAELVAASRDNGQPATEALATAQRLLNHPDVISSEIAAEITRQVYDPPRLSPSQEAASVQGRCLTPVQAGTHSNVSPSNVSPHSMLAPIRLDIGINHIETPEGILDITLSWSDEGHGHGHDVFTAVLPGAGTVSMPDGDAIADDPASDQDMRRSVRFARGQINGRETVVLLTAQRDPGDGPVRTTYRTYRLQHEPDGYRFGLTAEMPLPDGYCNADAALSAASGLPLRKSYRGPNTPDGCPPRRSP